MVSALNSRWLSVTGFLIASAVSATPASADDAQLWTLSRVNVKVAPRLLLGNETIFRTSEQRGDYDLVDHVLLGYQLDRKITVWIGYTHQTAMSHGRTSAIEQRFRQQLNFDNVASFGPVIFGGRVRLEERWRTGQIGTGWRLRPQIRLTMPLTDKVALAANHESFIDLNRTSFQSVSGEERMRNAITLSAILNKHLSAEAGYLQQHLFYPTNTVRNANVATFSLAANF